MANASGSWDDVITDPTLLGFFGDVSRKLAGDGDPSLGVWSAKVAELNECTVWTDASDVGLGVVLQVDGATIEDQSWLRPSGDKRHINVVELEAAIKGLSLAIGWNFETVHLKTDSKIVASWLRDVIGNVRRVRTKALYEVLVQRRLQIVADMIQTAKWTVTVDWVPSAGNPADVMTRVPEAWVKLCQASRQTADVVAISAPSLVTLTQVSDAQACDADIRDAIMRLTSEPKLPVTGKFAAVAAQLEVDEGVLFRSVKLPILRVQSMYQSFQMLWSKMFCETLTPAPAMATGTQCTD